MKTSETEVQTNRVIAGFYFCMIRSLSPEPRFIGYYKDVIYHMVA